MSFVPHLFVYSTWAAGRASERCGIAVAFFRSCYDKGL